jgi:hypothetical protein
MPAWAWSLGLTQSHAQNRLVAMHKSVDARVPKVCRESDGAGLAGRRQVDVGGVSVLDGAQLLV